MTPEMSPSPAFVVVLDRSDALVHSLIKAVDGLDDTVDVHLFTKAAEVGELFASGPVDVLLVGPSEMTAAGLKRVARWHAAHPATVIMVACAADALPDPQLLMKAGAEQLLKLPAGAAAVRRALLTALGASDHLKDQLTTVIEVPAPRDEEESVRELSFEEPAPEPEPEPEPEMELVPEPERLPAITITVASATGGCGKTFLATNLAYLLAQGTRKRIAMIDLDLQFGEVVATLQLKPQRTIADVEIDEDGHIDVQGLMTPHAGGFDVLAAPPDPVAAEGLSAATISAVIEQVRKEYDFVLIDTPPSLNEVVLGAFDLSDHLIVLATLDVPSVRNMRVFLTTLDRLQIPTDGLHLVLNKAERGVELTADDIQRVLGRTWDLELPYDREVSRSVNLGLPVSEAAPRAEVSRRLVAGVSTLLPEAGITPVTPAPEHSLLERILSALRPRKEVTPRTAVLVEEKTS